MSKIEVWRPSVVHPLRGKLCLRARFATIALSLISAFALSPVVFAGTWSSLIRTAPGAVDTMLLLSDGTVMAAAAGGSGWFRLTPDIHGSYVNGTWSTLASMHDTRLYYSSAVLRDGRVFVAGGEYGTGTSNGETYDPISNTWTMAPASGQSFSDSICKIVANGNVLIAPVGPSTSGGTILFNPTSNSWITGGKLFRGSYQDEASWVKLPDDSILTIDPFGANSERYIPSSNTWINDSIVPVVLYDAFGSELGAAFLLPDGRAFFLGANGHTAFYTPTGTASPGSWAQGPDIPNNQGTPDAPAAMMVNGKILCAVSPVPTSANHFPSPTSFYEYDPVANSWANVGGPTGSTDNLSPYVARMLALPDGSILYSHSSSQLYVYRTVGAPLALGKPVIAMITQNGDGTFHLAGTGLNGISEGAAYGDDAQMDSNYPLVRLTNSSGNVYYARTFNWSSTGVMTSNKPVSTEFSLPASVTPGTYALAAVANGISSDLLSFTTTVWRGPLSGDWDTSTLNWMKSAVGSNYNQGDFVIFDDSVTGTTNVNLTTTLLPGGILFNNARSNYVVNGAGKISGITGLSKNGAAALVLAGTGGDDFTGAITVNGGTLILDNAGSAITGSITIGANGTLQSGNNDANGNFPGGNTTNNGTLIFYRTDDLTVPNLISGLGGLVQNGPNTLTLSGSSTYKGSTRVNAGVLALSGTGSISGSSNVTLLAPTILNVTGRLDGTITLFSGQTLQGNGTVVGSVSGNAGSTISVGTGSPIIGSLVISSNVNLHGTTALKIDPVSLTNDVLYAYGVTYGGTLSLSNLSTPFLSDTRLRLFVATNYAGAFAAVSPLTPGPGLAWDMSSLAIDGTIGIMYTLGDTWKGAVDGNWDIATPNWATSGAPAIYAQGDIVTFDDAVVGATTVVLTTALTPASITFNNSASNYVLSGSGSLSGPIGINKNYPGTVTLTESGGDNFSGGVTVNNGTLVLDNPNSLITGNSTIGFGATLQSGINDSFGNLPSGNIALNGRLVFNRTNNLSVGNLISGFGTLIKSNNNVLTIARNNANWTGAVTVAQGTLQLSAINALGNGTNVPITVNNGATLDVNGVTGTNSVVVSGAGVNGNGALVNNNASIQAFPAMAFMTLTGNTTIGGFNRWDLRPASSSPDTLSPTFAGLSTGGQPYSLTKTGANFIGIVSATVDPKLANVTVQSGTLNLEGALTGLGNPANLLTVFNGATLELWNLAPELDKVVVLNDGATVLNGSGANVISGPIIIATNAPASAGNCTFNIGGTYLWTTGGMSGRGNVIKNGVGTLYVSGANTYTGSTRINSGTLALFNDGTIYKTTNITISIGAALNASGRTDTTFALTNGQTLQGSGSVNGILIARAGSTIMPATGTLTVSSNATLQGACFMKLNPATLANDALRAARITLGGTLTVSNVSATPFAPGNSFRMFIGTSYAGGFTSLSPSNPGIGLAWNTNSLSSNGTLSVVALPSPGIASFTLSGTNLVVNGTNGVANRPYIVLMSTDVSLPLNQWSSISTNTFAAAGNFTITATNAIDPLAPQRFFALEVQ